MIENYKIIQSEYVKEIDSTVHIYEHLKTKAKVMYIEADDAHKTFGIGFRTTPPDSTGVPHIIEHSVLCGSKKYPLKDPFIELSKGSLNTYLNAMTYPDKTLYPVSSQNNADFHNLMDVYLDAVFFPNIYNNDYILMQEGWRYHIEKEEDDLAYKGVVYNEMKGAFSSPEEVTFRKIKEALFPDTTYANESGGAPEFIPDLSYEDFLAFHKQYYHPSNCYIGLYGDLNIEETLKFIDEEYLSRFEYQKVDSEIATQEPFTEVHSVTHQYSVAEEKPNQLYLSYNCVVGDVVNRKLMIDMGILEYLLLETPASPLKKRLINEGIGDDIFGAFQTHMKQPIFSIVAKNVTEDKKERFYEVIEEELKRIAEEGISKPLLDAAVQVKEFELREGDFKGYSKGLLYFIGSMKSWLYDADPTIYLKYETIIDGIREQKDKGHFENLIKTYLLGNTHAVKVVLEPKVNLDLEIEEKVKAKLATIKASWDEETLKAHIEKTKAFNAYQEQEESEEARQSIPILKKEELTREMAFPRYEINKVRDKEYITTSLFTNQISYISWYIDLEGIENQYMPYLGTLVGMFSKLDTENYAYEDLSIALDAHLGSVETHIQAMHNLEDPEDFRKIFVIRSKALVHELEWQVKLMKELITGMKIENATRIREIIKEMKAMMEMALSSEGHKIAYGRLLASFSPTELFEEETKGLTFYHFVCDLDNRWDEDQEEIIAKLKQAYSYLANGSRYTIGITADPEEVKKCIVEVDRTLETFKHEKTEPLQTKFIGHEIQEGIIYPGNVNYVAMGYNFKKQGHKYNGGMLMLKSILSMDYLWTEVRVKSGAYGCFADFRKSGNVFFVSYRDPNITQTLEAYRNAADYISKLNLSERELVQYLIGTISSMDFPYTASTEGKAAQLYHLTNTSKEDLQKMRDELFEANNETLRSFAPIIADAVKMNQYCVFGNTTSIPENKDLFTKTTKA